MFCVFGNRSLPSRWSSASARWEALGATRPGATRHRGGGRPAYRRVQTPSGPRKSGMPESVLIPAPVKATMYSDPTIHRASVSVWSSRWFTIVSLLGALESSMPLSETVYSASQTSENPLEAKLRERPEDGSFGGWSNPLGRLRWVPCTLSERSALDPRKRNAGGCAHTSPVVVEPVHDRRRARCLGCGQLGPPRPSSAWALAALRDEAGRSLRGRAEGLGNGGGPVVVESQLSELRNMRVVLEQARLLARDLAYHCRARLEAAIGRALDEVDGQIEELRARGAAGRRTRLSAPNSVVRLRVRRTAAGGVQAGRRLSGLRKGGLPRTPTRSKFAEPPQREGPSRVTLRGAGCVHASGHLGQPQLHGPVRSQGAEPELVAVCILAGT